MNYLSPCPNHAVFPQCQVLYLRYLNHSSELDVPEEIVNVKNFTTLALRTVFKIIQKSLVRGQPFNTYKLGYLVIIIFKELEYQIIVIYTGIFKSIVCIGISSYRMYVQQF